MNISQYTAGLIARFPLIDKAWFNLDVGTELGVANTRINVNTVTKGQGVFKKEGGFIQRASISAAIGTSIKFFVEAGQEWNDFSDRTYERNLTTNNFPLDLSGTFYGLGITIQGIPGWITPGTITVGK